MTDVLLVAHHERVEAAALARQAATWLTEHGHSAWMTPEDAEPLELLDLVSERKPESAGLALSLGGDGTMLRTVKMLGGSGVPIIGVNIGLLGYLTEVEPPALTAVLERWAAGSEAGEWRIEERMMLDATLHRQWRRHDRIVEGAERGCPREAGSRSHRSAVGSDRRSDVHVVRRRRFDHRHTDRFDRVLAVGSWPSRVADASCALADAGVATHALRSVTGARSRRRGRDRGHRRPSSNAVDRWPDGCDPVRG